MGRRRLLTGAVALLIAASGSVVASVPAHAEELLPTGAVRQVGTLNTTQSLQYDRGDYAHPDPVDQYVTPTVDLAIVKHDKSKLTVDTLDAGTFATTSTRTVALDPAFPIWGGFLAGADGHFYVLTGRSNHSESKTLTVLSLRRYNPEWTLVGTGYVKGGATQGTYSHGIYDPFDATAPDMALVGDRLVVHMARTQFKTDDGVHHQVNMTLEAATATMTVKTFDELKGDPPYSSHSFRQLVTTWQDGAATDLITVDHGDAYPRAIEVGVVAGYPANRGAKTYEPLTFKGQIGANYTGAWVTGLASGPQGVVVLASVTKDASDTNDHAHNIVAIAVDPRTGKSTVRRLTSFAAKGTPTAIEPRVTQVGPDRFAVLYGVYEGSSGDKDNFRTEYRLIDSAGAVLASKAFPKMYFPSTTDPVVVGHTLTWVGFPFSPEENPAPAYLYALDVTNPAAPAPDPRIPATPKPLTAAPNPTMSGYNEVGYSLTVDPGKWGPAPVRLTYQWYADDVAIAGATGRTLQLTAALAKHVVYVRITGDKPGYATTRRNSEQYYVFPGELTAPTPKITGRATVGSTLTVSPGKWGPAPVALSYQWYAGSSKINNATRTTLKLTASLRGKQVSVQVIGRKSGYSTTTRGSARTGKITG